MHLLPDDHFQFEPDPRALQNAARNVRPETVCGCLACQEAWRHFGVGHASDCAVHAGPAEAAGACSCTLGGHVYRWPAVEKTVRVRPPLDGELLARHIAATTLPSRRLPRALPFLLGVLFGVLLGAAGLFLAAIGG